MREFRIVFDQLDSVGEIRPEVCRAVKDSALDTFGGYTLAEGNGGFILASSAKSESPNWIFDIASDKSEYYVKRFAQTIANMICKRMNQESIYFRNIDGMVDCLESDIWEKAS